MRSPWRQVQCYRSNKYLKSLALRLVAEQRSIVHGPIGDTVGAERLGAGITGVKREKGFPVQRWGTVGENATSRLCFDFTGQG
jgi:hypothetical protein